MSSELEKLEQQYQLGVLHPCKLLDYYQNTGNPKYLKFRSELGYVAETLDLPLPTDEQTKQFVDYVANAHSWYKHLHPINTTPFIFFLDRYVMMLRQQDGSIVEVADNDSALFHYSSMPTQQYRQKFGYWTYARAISYANAGTILSEDGNRVLITKDLLDAGTAHLTSNMFGSVDFEALAKLRAAPELDDYPKASLDLLENTEQEHRKMYKAMNAFLKELENQRNNFRLFN